MISHSHAHTDSLSLYVSFLVDVKDYKDKLRIPK